MNIDNLIENSNQAFAKLYAWIDNDSEKLIAEAKNNSADPELLWERMKAINKVIEIIDNGKKGLKVLSDEIFEVAKALDREKRKEENDNFDWLIWHQKERQKYGDQKWNLTNYQLS